MTETHDIKVECRSNKPGSTKCYVAATLDDDLLHSDTIDIAKQTDRHRFVSALKDQYPGVDIEQLDQVMQKEAYQIVSGGVEAAGESRELDTRDIIRPHLFHLPEASGLLVPVAYVVGNGRPAGKWVMCVQWSDGRRECTDFREWLDLDDGGRIWFDPIPPSPAAKAPSRWSRRGRDQWANGYTPRLDDLFERISGQIAHYIEFPPEDRDGIVYTLSLWTMLTYLYPVWPALPYLSFGGPWGSGKSKVFEVLLQMVWSPLSSSNMTAPCLFRTLHSQGGTLLLDEAERLSGRASEAGELRSILLAGYKRGGKANRLEPADDGYIPREFDVFGPKAFAAIQNPPPALASRCIQIVMFRAGPDSPVSRRHIDPAASKWREIRDDLYAMALAHGARFVRMADFRPGCRDLNGRAFELWRPILAIATAVEEAGVHGLVATVEAFAVKTAKSVNESAVPEADEILLRQLYSMLRERPWGATAAEILMAARREEPALFDGFSPKRVGSVLGRYGMKSRRSAGKRLFRPDQRQWQTIERSYGIGIDAADQLTKEVLCQ